MTDFARLGMTIDSRPAVTASTNLDRMTVAGARAERSVDGISKTSRRATSVLSGLGRAVGGVAVAFLSFQTLSTAAKASLEFSSAIAEVSTLLEGTPKQLNELEASARGLSTTFGGTATAQTKAFYQAISAGAGSVAEATALLTDANKLAIGGVTDVTTAVDILTTVTSSYGKDVISTQQASDALFVGMKAGKTTVGELSSTLGAVIPLAKGLGVSFEETVAATSALTTQGLTTAQSVTGLRAALTSVVKPSDEAGKVATALGLKFDAAALKSQGLSGFLESVVTATGGSAEAMAKLFGSVEATTAVLALAGGGSAKLAAIMDEMKTKAGATDEAFAKMSKEMKQRLNVQLAIMGDVLLTVGNALVSIMVPTLEAVTGGFKLLYENSRLVLSVLVGLAATTIPAIGGALVSTALAVGSAATATGILTGAVGALRLALVLLGGPLGLLYAALGAAAAYFLIFKDNAKLAEDAAYNTAAAESALRGEMEAFATSSGPAARTESMNRVVSLKEHARAALLTAQAELTLASAMQQDRLANAPDWIKNANADGVLNTKEVDAATTRVRDLNIQILDMNSALADMKASGGNTGGAVATALPPVVLNDVSSILAGLEKNTGGAAKATKGLTDEQKAAAKALKDSAKAATDLKEEMDRPLVSAIDGVASAFGDFIAGGLRDFKSFTSSIIGSFKSMISQMIATAISNPIKIALGVGGSVGGTAASAASAAGGGGGVSSILGGLGSVGKALGGIGAAFTGGFGIAAGGLMSGGIGGMFSAIGAQAGTALATGTLTSIAATIGAVALPVAALFAVVSFFKKKVTQLNAGISGTATAMGITAQSFNTIQTSRFWGLSKRTSTSYSALDQKSASALDSSFSMLFSSVKGAAAILGVADSAFSAFSYNFSVSLKGLSAEAQQSAIEAAFKKMGNAMADMAGDLSKYATANEESMDTLNRLSSSLRGVNDAFRDLGFSAYQTSLAGGAAADAFAGLFGGLDAFASSTQAYYSTFYSEAERTANATARLSEALMSLGINAIPSSLSAYRKLVDAAMGSGNEVLASTLIQLSPAFAEVKAAAGSLNDTLSTTADLFATAQDKLFTQSGIAGGYTSQISGNMRGADSETIRLLQELLESIKTGNLNIARNTSKTAALLERIELDPPV